MLLRELKDQFENICCECEIIHVFSKPVIMQKLTFEPSKFHCGWVLRVILSK